jgi:hypothetical protein|tara:strand:- start:345 stop:548 length:204 start_codon:yes stop_codon:yes gene_type:complete
MNKTEVMIIGLSIAFIILVIRLVILKYEFKLWNKYIMDSKYNIPLIIISFIVIGIIKYYKDDKNKNK